MTTRSVATLAALLARHYPKAELEQIIETVEEMRSIAQHARAYVTKVFPTDREKENGEKRIARLNARLSNELLRPQATVVLPSLTVVFDRNPTGTGVYVSSGNEYYAVY